MSELPSIAVLMETSGWFGRGVIEGIVQYASVHGPWLFHIQPGGLDVSLPPEDVWHGVGVIGRVRSVGMARAIQARRLHLVCMGGPAGVGPRLVGTSPESICRAALEHLRERGFTQFACAAGRGGWQRQRLAAFGSLAAQAGYPCQVFQHTMGITHARHLTEQEHLAQWLRRLPRPVGLFACDDTYGRFLLDVCRIAGLHVPEEIAVVGVDNHELFCQMANPPLSSVALNAQRIGFEAAALMDQMIHGQHPRQWVEVPPLGVVTRQSSDILAIADPDVAQAVRYIREHACEGISAEDVMKQVVCSQRTLQVKFARIMGHSPYAEVRRVRLERAKTLLVNSDMKLELVARACGMGNVQHLFATFQQELGMTPSEFRRRNRPGR